MLKRAALLAVAVVVVTAAPVGAQNEYDGTTGAITVSDSGEARASGEGCPPEASVNWAVTKDGAPFTQGSTMSDANGDFQFTFTAQGDGNYSATVECGEAAVVLGATVSRGAESTGGQSSGSAAANDELAFTGSDRSLSAVQVGAALVVLGALAVAATRRRQKV